MTAVKRSDLAESIYGTSDDRFLGSVPGEHACRTMKSIRKVICGEDVEVPIVVLAALHAGERILRAAVIVGVIYLLSEVAYAFFSGRVAEVLQ